MSPANDIVEFFTQIENNIKSVIREDSPEGQELWKKLLLQHPADIAQLLEKLGTSKQRQVFKKLPRPIAAEVFQVLPEMIQVPLLKTMTLEETTAIFNQMSSDQLTDLFGHLTEEDLKNYLKLIQQKQRNKVLSLLTINPDSAGRVMNSDVLTLERDFTVKKSVAVLQHIKIPKETLRRIYVTSKENLLVGYINLEDLIINAPETPLARLVRENELIINVNQDQEDVARQMHHYDLLSAPVVDEHGYFLGVITAADIVEIVEEEASEDVYKMSGLSPVVHSYFQTSFSNLLWQRSLWLGGLLLLQSISGFVLSKYQTLIQGHLFLSFFYTMLIGTGGNAGNQSATLVIRGLATGEISRQNAFRVLMREFSMSIAIAVLLFIITFARVYFIYPSVISATAISLSLFLIINMSMVIGTFIPFLLERLNLDPAHSAAPFLATLMDILGIFIYCVVCNRILG